MNQLLIPVELLARQLQEIPGLKVSIKFDDPLTDSYSTDVLFEDWARRWLETYKKGIVKDNSFYGTYRNPVENHLIPYFGGHTLSEVRPPDVQLYFKSLQTTLSLETQKKIRSAMHAIYDTAIECGICISNPVTKSLKLVSTILPTEKNTWSLEQYDTAAKFALRHKHGLHIITLMETAITRSELLINKFSTCKKGHHERAAEISDAFDGLDGNGHCFCDQRYLRYCDCLDRADTKT